jgi:hypothetical protein
LLANGRRHTGRHPNRKTGGCHGDEASNIKSVRPMADAMVRQHNNSRRRFGRWNDITMRMDDGLSFS